MHNVHNEWGMRWFLTPFLIHVWWWMNVSGTVVILALLLIGQLGLRIEGWPESLFAMDWWQAVGVALVLLVWLIALRIILEFYAVIFSIYDRLGHMLTVLERPPHLGSPVPIFPWATRKPYAPLFHGSKKGEPS